MNGYQYRCIVSSTCVAPVSSNTATLTVSTPPVINNSPLDAAICVNGTTSFSVSATGPGLAYQWQLNTGSGWSNIGIGPGIFGQNNPTLIVSLVQQSQNGYQYRCLVTGTCSPASLSGIATLTVNTSPTITVAPPNTNVCPGGNTSITAVSYTHLDVYKRQIHK